MRNSQTTRQAAVVLCTLVLGAAAVMAQAPPAPILSHTFEENDGGWHAFGGDSTVSLVHDAPSVKSGKGALQFAYSLKKGEFSGLILPTPDMVLGKGKSIKFWVRADHGTPLAFTLQEKDGGRYAAIFTVPKDGWQQVELSTADLVLDRSKDAPKDPNGKLDMEEVETAGIFDVAQLFVQGDAAIASAFGISEGPRKLLVDDFTVSSVALPSASTLKDGEGSLDTFARPQVGWTGVGEVQLSRITGKPLEGTGLQAKYHQSPTKMAGIAKAIPMGSLKGATKLALSAASIRPSKIVVQVEEAGGGKYNTIVELSGNSVRADLTLNLADFKASQDSHDDNGKLDLDQVTQLILFDASGLVDNADGDTTLWLNNVRALK